MELPPLRDRPSDIPVLARHFLEKRGARTNPAVKSISAAALARLSAYRWPGNVRELENIMEPFAAFLGTSRSITDIDYQAFLAEAEELGDTAAGADVALPAPEAPPGHSHGQGQAPFAPRANPRPMAPGTPATPWPCPMTPLRPTRPMKPRCR